MKRGPDYGKQTHAVSLLHIDSVTMVSPWYLYK